MSAASPYESRFANWERRASVRVKPRRSLPAAEAVPPFFPPESAPAATHPLVVARGPGVVNEVLLHMLYQYLHFTTVLEQVAVLPVTARIALGTSGVDLPRGMRADAFKITTDEAWHAQFSYDFIEEVAGVTGVPAGALVEPGFVGRLDRIRADFPPDNRSLVDLLFAVVSETLVSALLSEIPNDRRLPRPVRELVADHAADEGRHHAYFRSFLRHLWPRLSADEARRLGPMIPEFVRAFLAPDLTSVSAILHRTGFTAGEVGAVLDEAYGPHSPVNDLEPAARATVRSFLEVGALDDPGTRAAFTAAGLVLPGDPDFPS